jgi:hypothetical protein
MTMLLSMLPVGLNGSESMRVGDSGCLYIGLGCHAAGGGDCLKLGLREEGQGRRLMKIYIRSLTVKSSGCEHDVHTGREKITRQGGIESVVAENGCDCHDTLSVSLC